MPKKVGYLLCSPSFPLAGADTGTSERGKKWKLEWVIWRIAGEASRDQGGHGAFTAQAKRMARASPTQFYNDQQKDRRSINLSLTSM